ncbi:MAG: BRO-N domain-containing protein [Candidatus Hodarchaeales archaeon]|jgi:prophage antirepressor-like protein
MFSIEPVVHEFDGHQLTVVNFNGRPCWSAKEVGLALGYGEGGTTLAKVLVREWSEDFTEGEEYSVLVGKELADYKALLEDSNGSILSRSARYMVLYESGVNMVCLKTRKPAGSKLRRWLAREVMPQIRKGEISLQNTPQICGKEDSLQDIFAKYPDESNGCSCSNTESAEVERMRLENEAARLKLQEKELNLLVLNSFSECLNEHVKIVGDVEVTKADIIEQQRVVAEVITGRTIDKIKSQTELDDGWLDFQGIANCLGVSCTEIRRVAHNKGLCTNIDGVVRSEVRKSSTSNRTVIDYFFSPKGVAIIARVLESMRNE